MDFNYYVSQAGIEVSYHDTLEEALSAAQALRAKDIAIFKAGSNHLVSQACAECGAVLRAYWLKQNLCNACRNPHLVVMAVLK